MIYRRRDGQLTLVLVEHDQGVFHKKAATGINRPINDRHLARYKQQTQVAVAQHQNLVQCLGLQKTGRTADFGV